MSSDSDRELDRIVEHYSRRAEDSTLQDAWSPLRPGMLALLQQREQALVWLLRKAGFTTLSGARILEIGAGDANVLATFQRLGAKAANLHGVDLMADRVAAARAEHPGFDVRQGDATKLEYDDGSFDVVTQFTVFSSVEDAAMRARLAEEMQRVTAAEGIVIWYDLTPGGFGLRVARAIASRLGSARAAAQGETPAPALEESDSATESSYEVRPIAFSEAAALFADWRALRVPANVALDLGDYGSPARVLRSDYLRLFSSLRTHEMIGFRRPEVAG